MAGTAALYPTKHLPAQNRTRGPQKKSPGARRTPPITAFSATSSALTGARARTGAHGAWRREIAAKPCEKGRYRAMQGVTTLGVLH